MGCKGTCIKLDRHTASGQRVMRSADGTLHPQCPECMNTALPMPDEYAAPGPQAAEAVGLWDFYYAPRDTRRVR